MVSDQWAPAATPSSTPSPSTSQTQAPTGTPTMTEDQKALAAVAYILTWITGLIIFFVAKKEQRYARWHAVQAIGLGIVAFAVGIVFNMLSTMLAFGSGGLAIAAFLGLLSFAFSIAVIVLIILCAVKAYQGTPMRLPVLADFADKYA